MGDRRKLRHGVSCATHTPAFLSWMEEGWWHYIDDYIAHLSIFVRGKPICVRGMQHFSWTNIICGKMYL